eukprot:1158402-Pelagomonas_calceolata.AAC.17
MDLPVIMVSGNGDTETVLRGVTHGATQMCRCFGVTHGVVDMAFLVPGNANESLIWGHPMEQGVLWGMRRSIRNLPYWNKIEKVSMAPA